MMGITDKDLKDMGASFGSTGKHGDDKRIKILLQEFEATELRKVRDELSEMETKKEKYKSYYT